jgi:FlaG/FlaF family flagellin (archaellin)
MPERARAVLVAVVVLVVIGVPLAVLLGGGGGDDSAPKPKPHRATGVRVERGTSDLTIYVKPAVNVPASAAGRRQVLLKCVDSNGDTVQAQDEAWPFAETDQGAFDPHAHLVLDPLSITAVERCLLEGTEPLLVARVR